MALKSPKWVPDANLSSKMEVFFTKIGVFIKNDQNRCLTTGSGMGIYTQKRGIFPS